MSVWVTIGIAEGDNIYVPAEDDAEAANIVTSIETAIKGRMAVTITANNGRVTINPRYITTASYGKLNS